MKKQFFFQQQQSKLLFTLIVCYNPTSLKCPVEVLINSSVSPSNQCETLLQRSLYNYLLHFILISGSGYYFGKAVV